MNGKSGSGVEAQVIAIQPLLLWVKEVSLWAHNAAVATSIDDGAPLLNFPLSPALLAAP